MPDWGNRMQLSEENRRLRREVAELRRARDFWKRTAHAFATALRRAEGSARRIGDVDWLEEEGDEIEADVGARRLEPAERRFAPSRPRSRDHA